MGIQNVYSVSDKTQMRTFMRTLMRDLQAMEYMLENDLFESNVHRIGAEQELCIIDKFGKPAPIAMSILEKFHPKWLTTELAKFNLETNLNPQKFEGDCFSEMETEISSYIFEIMEQLPDDYTLLLTGILPTIRKPDMRRDNITPIQRYYALLDGLREMRGKEHELRLNGIDELIIRHDSPFLEACNTSFQVHLQVSPHNFVQFYNIALAIAAPVLAIAANSPLLFGKRLWHETRIALFQQSVDTRVSHDHLRERSPRVTFGNYWVKESILEIYKEDIARYRPILSTDIEEDPLEMLRDGQIPKLRALQVNNSTVYRWNRPCFGVTDGVPHLRIENRVLPAGPTVVDEVANAAFWLGLMVGMSLRYDDIRKQMDFVDARDNFMKAARYGIDSKFTWIKDKKISACDLILTELLPIAREGLEARNVSKSDIDRYLDVIKGRAEAHTNGARWMLRGYTDLLKKTNKDEALSVITAAMQRNQQRNQPVHTWDMPQTEDLNFYEPAQLAAEDLMTTDLVTAQKDDILEVVANMIDWHHVRHIPVEDERGKLIGLVTARQLLHHFSKQAQFSEDRVFMVKDIMESSPVVISPETKIGEAIEIMEAKSINCLPVVKDGELLGMLTERNILDISRRLLKRQLSDKK